MFCDKQKRSAGKRDLRLTPRLLTMGEEAAGPLGNRARTNAIFGESAVGWNGVMPAELEFAAAQQLLGKRGGDALFEKPIRAWFTAADRECFRGDSLRSLRNVLLSSFSEALASVGNDDASAAILI